MRAYILHLEPGLRVAVRQQYRSWRGTIDAVTRTTVRVLMDDGSWRRFAIHSKLEIGSIGHRAMRPYLCTVAEADERDAAHTAAQKRAAERLSTGQSPDWSVVKGMSF